MNAAQANRARIAQRAGVRRNAGGVNVNPAARATPVLPGGNVRNRRAVRLTATQRNGQGRFSEWNLSPYEPYGGWR